MLKHKIIFNIGDHVKVEGRKNSLASTKYSGREVVITRVGSGWYNLNIEGGDSTGFWNDELKLLPDKEWD